MKTIIRIISIGLLLAIGFAAGFPIGSITGFTRGSEWALVQADVLAREAGLSMPVGFDGGMFHVIMKQPRGLYKKVWHEADKQALIEASPGVRRDEMKKAHPEGMTTDVARLAGTETSF
jgi:hypothetical protein